MCIWDRLQMRARCMQPRAYVEMSDPKAVPPVIDLPIEWGRVESYRVEARLGVEYRNNMPLSESIDVKALMLHEARESLARLLYEDVIDQVRAIEQAVLEEKREHALRRCEHLLRYMTDDSARPQTEQDCHATS